MTMTKDVKLACPGDQPRGTLACNCSEMFLCSRLYSSVQNSSQEGILTLHEVTSNFINITEFRWCIKASRYTLYTDDLKAE
jgi:hypothetical protein